MEGAVGIVRIRVPGDKSITQRALILSALAEGESRLTGVLPGDDPEACADVLRSLGVAVPALPSDGSEIRITGVGLRGLLRPSGPLDSGNSGTCARLMVGVLAGQHFDAELTGDASLRRRPMGRVTGPLSEMGARFEALGEEGRMPLRVHGGPLGAYHHRSEVASAQVKSALLLAGLVGGVEVTVTEPEHSRDHTERMLRALGCTVYDRPAPSGGHSVSLSDPPESLRPLDLTIPGDFSSAAFMLVLGTWVAGPEGLEIEGVGLNPTRTGLLAVLRRMGARVEVDPHETGPVSEPIGVLRVHAASLRGTEVGPQDRVASFIDEIPALVVAAVRSTGSTTIRGARELRVKETDRIAALVGNLGSIGVEAEELEDGLIVHGTDRPLVGQVRAYDDHRIAMAFGILGALPGNDIQVDDPSVVDVSFPGFWPLIAEVAASNGGGRGRVSGLLVTIDGPAGSGKTSTAKEVAERLGSRHLDSGALYRALTLALLNTGAPADTWEELGPGALDGIDVGLVPSDGGFDVEIDGVTLRDELRTETVTRHVSQAAQIPAVRARLFGLQRSAAGYGGLVGEGRDLGTVVFPEAQLKVFLVADLAERARRRFLEREGRTPSAEEEASESDRLAARDAIDAGREIAPLSCAEDAVTIDTTRLSIDEQVAEIVRLAQKRSASATP